MLYELGLMGWKLFITLSGIAILLTACWLLFVGAGAVAATAANPLIKLVRFLMPWELMRFRKQLNEEKNYSYRAQLTLSWWCMWLLIVVSLFVAFGGTN
ncbi:TPA: hypothetical protein ACW7QF_001901 [Klebsiella aerogenes]|uniref:hypothetical protein n=1 Tax=Klebsiella TaxID=570 RepID=UPI0029280FEF|nr:hypothetical protein [Klebsiella sp. 141203]MDU9363220.1 hypothetical protein [Klebsiella sp. 141203]HEP0588713.1 hypothetical protein [Klebsiella aerogenes]